MGTVIPNPWHKIHRNGVPVSQTPQKTVYYVATIINNNNRSINNVNTNNLHGSSAKSLCLAVGSSCARCQSTYKTQKTSQSKDTQQSVGERSTSAPLLQLKTELLVEFNSKMDVWL